MLNRLYSRFLEPRASHPDDRNREFILNCLLVASLLLSLGEFLDLMFGFAFLGHHYVGGRVISIVVVASCFGLAYWQVRYQQRQRLISYLLIGLLLLAACITSLCWGTMTPTGVLLFGVIIVMSGILLGARYSVYLAAIITLWLSGLEYAKLIGWVKPDLSWTSKPSEISDVLGLSGLYATMAIVSWLFNRQMERSLKRAQVSEAALLKQKDLLEVKVEERGRQLAANQLEKVQQIYRFAELGRISSALFHDLANHLSTVSLDIEGLQQQQRPDLLRRINHDIHYIDDVVQRVRQELRGKAANEQFDICQQTEEIIKILNYKAGKARVSLNFIKPNTVVLYTSDLTRFRQIIINLLSNGIDAYPPSQKSSAKRIVNIEIEAGNKTVVIRVTDHGTGISLGARRRIFEPFYSTKDDGTGIGLFIVRQIVEQDFQGRISVSSTPEKGTIFEVVLTDKEVLKAPRKINREKS
ncbi:MAG: HAMP domain-containing sensor histidine kinase [Candidatus Saccharimonadales bacterium]